MTASKHRPSTKIIWRFAVLTAISWLPTGLIAQEANPIPTDARSTGLFPLPRVESPNANRMNHRPLPSGAVGSRGTQSTADANPAAGHRPFGPTVTFDGIFGDRHGIDGNDYSATAFLPWQIAAGPNVVFVVVRGTAVDAQQLVANFGLGHRRFMEPIDSIVGASVWFDFDKSRSQTYHRAGAQLEILGRILEVRGGADFVLGSNSSLLIAPQSSDTPSFFLGNNIVIGVFNTITPYDQGYLEVGGPLPVPARFEISAYGGAYVLWAGDVEDAIGWQARISADLSRDVQIGARITQDAVFGANVSGSVALTIPAGGMKDIVRSLRTIFASPPDSRSVDRRMSSHVVRDYRTPVHVTTTDKPVLAWDPQSDEPVFVLHVDSNATAQGSGTIESPFRALESARLANRRGVHIIRVVPREDDTGSNLSVAAPFQLFAHQRLLSSSVNHIVTTTRGEMPLPGFLGGTAPIISNSMATASAVVAMADGSEVSGFRIEGAGRHVGLQGNIDSFDINRNTIQNAANGVQFVNAHGQGRIVENQFLDNLNDGVNLTATNNNSLNLVVEENSASGNGNDAVDITTTGTSLTVSFFDNQFGGNSGDGISLTSRLDSNVTVNLRRNQLGRTNAGILGNGGAGFRFDSDSGFAALTIGGSHAADGNIVLGNGGESLAFNLRDTALAIVNSQNNVMPDAATGTATFDIVVEFQGGFSASQRAMFASAIQRWESIIIGDLPNVGSIDDVRIVAVIEPIDGPGGTLAEASPDGLRSGSLLPFLGTMHFDSADLALLEINGTLDDVVRHEVAHVLGYSTIWEPLGLVSGAGGSDPRFLGAQATAEYNLRFGLSESGVPLENIGDPGTIDAHWRESLFTNELMTGTIDGTVRPISRITIGQFIDIGYQVDMSQADPF